MQARRMTKGQSRTLLRCATKKRVACRIRWDWREKTQKQKRWITVKRGKRQRIKQSSRHRRHDRKGNNAKQAEVKKWRGDYRETRIASVEKEYVWQSEWRRKRKNNQRRNCEAEQCYAKAAETITQHKIKKNAVRREKIQGEEELHAVREKETKCQQTVNDEDLE